MLFHYISSFELIVPIPIEYLNEYNCIMNQFQIPNIKVDKNRRCYSLYNIYPQHYLISTIDQINTNM